LISLKEIRQFGRKIGREFHAERVVLFGSYAYGEPTADSDVDLLVVLPHVESPAHKAAEICLKLDPSFPVDVLVRTPERVRERLAMGDNFMREIVEKGEVLYEAANG
jgi:predicted nucleotidyltransferase